jgi:hypothetical protein
MILGGILVLQTMFSGWITVTLMWQGGIVAEGKILGSNGAVIGGCLLLLSGLVVALTKGGRRTGFRVVAIVASTLVLTTVVVTFVRSFRVASLMLAVSQGTSDGDRLQEWLAHGASVNATRSIGLFLAFGGGLLGLAGGILAVRERKSHLKALLVPAPPVPAPIS